MNSFIGKFLRAEFKQNPWWFLKTVVLLIPILSIVGMFATVQLVPVVNQRSFFKQAEYEWIAYSDEQSGEGPFFRSMDGATVANLVSSDFQIVYRPEVSIEMYLIDELSPHALKKSYFHRDNVLTGNLTSLTAEDGRLGMALSYNAAKRIGKKIGDEAILVFFADDGEPQYYPITIQAILRPYSSDGGGLGLALADSAFFRFVDEHGLNFQFAQFGDGDVLPAERMVFKRDQMVSASYYSMTDKNYVNLIFAGLGALAVLLIINREVQFAINRRLRTTGILSALGATKRTIITTIWLEQAVKIAIASLLAGIIYKFVLMERFIGEYIGLGMWLLLVSIYIITGLLSLMVASKRIESMLNAYSVPDIISKKPEGM